MQCDKGVHLRLRQKYIWVNLLNLLATNINRMLDSSILLTAWLLNNEKCVVVHL